MWMMLLPARAVPGRAQRGVRTDTVLSQVDPRAQLVTSAERHLGSPPRLFAFAAEETDGTFRFGRRYKGARLGIRICRTISACCHGRTPEVHKSGPAGARRR